MLFSVPAAPEEQILPVSYQQHWEHWYRRQVVVEGVVVGEEAASGRWANRHSPQGELAEAGHRPLEGAPGMKAGGRRRHRAWFGTRGEGPAAHHPAGEEAGAGSLARMGEGDWLKAVS